MRKPDLPALEGNLRWQIVDSTSEYTSYPKRLELQTLKTKGRSKLFSRKVDLYEEWEELESFPVIPGTVGGIQKDVELAATLILQKIEKSKRAEAINKSSSLECIQRIVNEENDDER